MALKPRYKRRILWGVVALLATLVLGVIIVPPMFTLNNMKPRIHDVILEHTGIDAEIRGDVHFSMIGHATIVAKDIVTPNGTVGAVMFTVPWHSIWDVDNAKLTGDISIYDADMKISSLDAPNIPHRVDIYNSNFEFQGKDYEVIRGVLDAGRLNGTVRTNDHKYEIRFADNEFNITNHNNRLSIDGQLYKDGTVRGRLAIDTDNINEFFEFSEPKIDGQIDLTTNFDWDGGYGFNFSDIRGDNFSGNIELLPNGERIIQISSPDVTYDFSFLANPSRMYNKTTFDLDLYGDLTFGLRKFNHVKVNAVGSENRLQISNVVADDIAIAGGYIDADGAHNIMINMPYNGVPAMCVFSGTTEKWECSAFVYGDINGSMRIDGDKYELFVQSNSPMPNREELLSRAAQFGKRGRVNFQFSDAVGTVDINGNDMRPHYTFAKNKKLSWLNPNLSFLPDFMKNDIGDFSQRNGVMEFTPQSKKYVLRMRDNEFELIGKNAKDLLPDIDLQSVNDMNYTVSGRYNRGSISELKIEFGGMLFTGSMSGNSITLHTDLLNIDTIANQAFVDNFEELEFLAAQPIVIPFGVPVNVSLSADALMYNGNEYRNFIYSLKKDIQTFSITDQARGNMLATISHDKSKYNIFVQLNRFVTTGDVLSRMMPLNVRDTMITAEINMRTSGHIAHDIIYNMAGDVNMSMDGGYLIGLGFDAFFAGADTITKFNGEYALADALSTGMSELKKLYITGKYENGNFITSGPMLLQLRHVDASGAMDISDGQMMVMLNMTLRGTSPDPQPIELRIMPDGARSYSLSEIMMNFDPDYMREFIKTHKRF